MNRCLLRIRWAGQCGSAIFSVFACFYLEFLLLKCWSNKYLFMFIYLFIVAKFRFKKKKKSFAVEWQTEIRPQHGLGSTTRVASTFPRETGPSTECEFHSQFSSEGDYWNWTRRLHVLTHRVPGEIKRSRDLRWGRWSWTLTFAQKRSWVGRWIWAEQVGRRLLRVVQVVRQQRCNGHCLSDSVQHSSWKSNCAVHKSLGNGEGTPP